MLAQVPVFWNRCEEAEAVLERTGRDEVVAAGAVGLDSWALVELSGRSKEHR